MDQSEITIKVVLGRGDVSTTVWTTDLSHDYVTINSDYRSQVSTLNSEVVHVAAAAIVNSDNEILISQRAADVHQGGLWEFPGGKLESGELVQQALLRELDEELGISATSYRPLIKVTHQYPDKTVLLDVWKVDDYTGQPRAKIKNHL